MIKLTLRSDKPIVVPHSHSYGVQGFIYTNLSEKENDFYHNEGYKYGKRTYKLFTYSELKGKAQREGGSLCYDGEVSLYINSYFPNFLNDLVMNLSKKGEVNFIGNQVELTSVEFPQNFEVESNKRYVIQTLSPIATRKTEEINGEKRETYFSPNDSEFENRLRENLYRKLRSVNSPAVKNLKMEQLTEEHFHLETISCSNVPTSVLFKKEDGAKVIRGYQGWFLVTGMKEFLEMGIKAGFGESNTKGLGMVTYGAIS